MPKKISIRIVQIIGFFDILVGVALVVVASFQFAKGASLLSGPKSDQEKLTRLVCYASIIFIFLLIHIAMAIQLFQNAYKVRERPLYAIKVFGWWREWSVVYLMAMLLHTIVVLLLMDDGARKFVCLVSTITHALLRPVGLVYIGKFKTTLENEIPNINPV